MVTSLPLLNFIVFFLSFVVENLQVQFSAFSDEQDVAENEVFEEDIDSFEIFDG